MAGLLHALEQRRLIDSNGIADGASIYFYVAGTLTMASIYADAALTTPIANPVVVAAGAAVPDIYLDPAVTYRRKIVYTDGGQDDTDPYEPAFASRAAIASAVAGAVEAEAGAVTAQEASEDARDEALTARDDAISAALGNNYYPGARSYVPRGATSIAITAAGTGGTNGSYTCPLTGDNLSVDAYASVTVAGGVVTAVSVAAPGLYIGASPTAGTVDVSTITGLTGATLTPTIGYLRTSGQYYLTDHASDASQVALFQNQANAAVEADASVDWLNFTTLQALVDAAALSETNAAASAASAAALNFPATLVAIVAALAGTGQDFTVAVDAATVAASAPATQVGTKVKVLRQGFDAVANPTTYVDEITAHSRVALPYPSTTSMAAPAFDAASLMLSDEIYSSDAIVPYAANTSWFAANGATLPSPVPVCQWGMTSRTTIGNTLDWEILAFHRDGRSNQQIRCVKVRATDGTNTTPWQIVSVPALSTFCEDLKPVEAFKGALDTSGLTDLSKVTLQAQAYPWIGTAASVADTSGITDERRFGERYFYKNTSRAANPPLVYVASTGNDTTGVCSTTAATAAASPCLTINGAIDKAVATLASGLLDGLEVRVVDTVALGTHSGAVARNQFCGSVIIKRAPTSASRAAAKVQQSAACTMSLGQTGLASGLTRGSLILEDVSWQRTASGQLNAGGGSAASLVQLRNVAFDNGTIAGSWISNASSVLRIFGCVWTNYNGNFTYTTGMNNPFFRGLDCPAATPEGTCIVSSRVLAIGPTSDRTKGPILYNNTLTGSTATIAASITASTVGDTITGSVVVGNLFEKVDAGSQMSLRISADSDFGNTVHTIVLHNVFTGYSTTGRCNLFYDEHTNTTAPYRRTHRQMRVAGNIFNQVATKSSVFVALNQGNAAEAPNRMGNWRFEHGNSCAGNLTQFTTNSPGAEAQYNAGPGSISGTSLTVRLDPLFVNYQGTTGSGGTPVAGAGGGDYHLQVGSPCRGIVPTGRLKYDWDGNAWPATAVNAGLYAT